MGGLGSGGGGGEWWGGWVAKEGGRAGGALWGDPRHVKRLCRALPIKTGGEHCPAPAPPILWQGRRSGTQTHIRKRDHSEMG